MAASFDTYACSVCSKSFGESHHRCSQHVNAWKGPCRLKGAFVKRVPVIVGRNDRNVGGRRHNDIDSEADANLLEVRAGSVSNLPVDSDDAGGGGELDSGYISTYLSSNINYISLNIHTYPCTYSMYLSNNIFNILQYPCT